MRATQSSPLSTRAATHSLRRGVDGWIRPLEQQPARPRLRLPSLEATAPRPASFSQERGFPRVEVLRSDSVLLVRAALPGVREEDLRIRIEETDLVIEGELRPVGDEVGCRMLVSEWTYGPFHRRVQLATRVDPAAMRTELRDGLLRIEIELAEPEGAPRPLAVC
jgi:HSP20 family protein